MKGIEKLANYFQKFPGIGPRQAKRFVYYLLKQDKATLKDIAGLIEELPERIARCSTCQRFFEADGYGEVCDICSSPNRDQHILMIVEKDADLEAIEKSSVYNGTYFVLGGTVPLLDTQTSELRTNDLLNLIKTRKGALEEVIIATGAHPEGELTADHVRALLSQNAKDVSITLLGRGLSTGTELEYSDRETIRQALQNRR